MDLPHITLVSFTFFEKSFLKKVADIIRYETNHNVKIREGHLDLTDFFDPARRQYNADKILKAVDDLYGNDSLKIIGLFNVDLFIPILTYIFGQAYLNGRTSIVSSYRLSNEGYGLKRDDNMFQERFAKEIIHELGHTLGLIHCHYPACVMRSGTYVEDIDQKGTAFCSACRLILSETGKSLKTGV
ncbi:MAG TPA: archaemetzincin family Zn-dependent metalloprotease [Bacteroidales bacterium]|nr:archaemetzincin family Zn-dependent metalloprotease [Bacteroidales bacterium]